MGGNSGGAASGTNGNNINMNLKLCREPNKNKLHYVFHRLISSSGLLFFVGCFALLALISTFYAWLVFTPYVRSSCKRDNEGSWSIGVYYGDSPFNLKPIESVNVWSNESAAWPVANPVLTCDLASESGFPSNFVSDPFLYDQGDTLFMFYETKHPLAMHGDIGVAKSIDKGATWQVLGIALDEDWHLSFPYVFDYLGQIYLMPESHQKGELHLYRALEFPLRWKLEKVIMKKPLVDATIINYDGIYWLFGSDHRGFGTKKNGQLEIWYSDSPLGPWKPHKKNPIYNVDKSFGARNGGRPFVYDGDLYRSGQDCGETYGRRVRIFKVKVLMKDEYKEVEVPLNLEESKKGRNAWNGARHHHLDVHRLDSGKWVAVIDGDRVPSGDLIRRFVLGCVLLVGVAMLVMLLGVIIGAVKCLVPLNWCTNSSGKRSDDILAWKSSALLTSDVRRFFSRMNRVPMFLRSWIKPNTWAGRLVIAVVSAIGISLMCKAVTYIYAGNGAEESYALKGHYSQFTLLAMTYEERLWNLKMYVKHYSRCSSVQEIVVVWNKGTPPKLNEFDSAVPVRVRVEKENSLNNRFKVDPLIKTRAVLELDDDIMMTCDDVERGFKVWRQYPYRLVGFYPRLIDGSPLKYRGEKYARAGKGYNMILTGAAFMDSQVAFKRYWGGEAKAGREFVDKYFNCEDVLMNFLYANSSSSRTVEYVRPAWAIDTSKLSNSAISRNTNVHYQLRSNCLLKFSELYGSLANRKREFDGRKDGWDL